MSGLGSIVYVNKRAGMIGWQAQSVGQNKAASQDQGIRERERGLYRSREVGSASDVGRG